MGLRGCINAAGLPLQILLQENPGWQRSPVAVTKEERPQSPILALNRAARDKGLAIGMKYASALSLVPGLRARAVTPDRVAAARQRIVRVLSAYSPDIEPCAFDTDAFWVSVDGLRSLFASEPRWVETVRKALAAEGFRVNIVVGFTRFGTYAIARSRPRSLVFTSPAEESEQVSSSSIDSLPLPPRTKGTLRKLEIRTVQQFVALPPGEMARRFGKEAALLRTAIISDDPMPIQPVSLAQPLPCRRRLDAPLTDLTLLMQHVDELLAIEVQRAEAQKSVIAGLTLILKGEEGEITTDVVRPAAPTLKTPLLRRLVQLRLSARQLSSGVADIEIRSERTAPSQRQEELFVAKGRDLRAGGRAFAALRARFGNDAVTCARIRDSHLPERSFAWVPLDRPVLPTASAASTVHPAAGSAAPASGSTAPAAVRRISFAPQQVPPGHEAGSPLAGPFVVSGSWWGTHGEDAPFHREYWFNDTPSGIDWLFVDRMNGASWIQGTID